MKSFFDIARHLLYVIKYISGIMISVRGLFWFASVILNSFIIPYVKLFYDNARRWSALASLMMIQYWFRYNVLVLLNINGKLWEFGHTERDGISNHQPHECLRNRLFRRRSKKTSKPASLACVRGIHRWQVNSPHKRPVTRKMFPFDKVIMYIIHKSVCAALWIPSWK